MFHDLRLAALALAIFSITACGGGSTAGGITPQPAVPTPFVTPGVVPPAPDYSSASTWLSLATAASGLNGVPANSGLTDLESSADVDVFYLSPTTSGDLLQPPGIPPVPLNEAWDDPGTQGLALEIAESQATPFNASARIYAPYYRQAKMNVWTDFPALVAQPAADLAYLDVKRAFEYYLDHYNGGRPIILVGHSQGSLMIWRLLAEEFDGKPLYRQLIAAYNPGQPVEANFFSNLSQVHACANATDTGCVNSWASFDFAASPATQANFSAVCFYWKQGGGNVFGAPGLPMLPSMNPLTWTSAAATAPASLNIGALSTTIFYPYPLPGIPIPMGSLIPKTYSAQTSGATGDYSAYVTSISPHLDPSWFSAFLGPFPVPFDGVWHLYDFNIYWMNIRQNARDRSNAFEKAAGVAKPLIAGPIAATVAAGVSMNYPVATINPATLYSAGGLPAGVTINASTGVVTGTPAAGVYTVVVSATNSAGTSLGELALTVQ